MSKNGYVHSKGIDYYYEVHGTGDPLLVLHGGLGSIEMFGWDIPALAKTHEVIAVELHGHGRTSLGDRPIDLREMADDMAHIVRTLGHERVDVLGYSLGGGVAFQIAARHPDLVRRAVLLSVCYKTEGFHPEMLPMQGQISGAAADGMKGTPMYETYAKIAPRPEDFPKLLDRMGEYMRKSFDFGDDISKLTMPVMLVYADHDMFPTSHMADFFNRLGGNPCDAGWQQEHMSQHRLAIIPGHTHYDILTSPTVIPTVLNFLAS